MYTSIFSSSNLYIYIYILKLLRKKENAPIIHSANETRKYTIIRNFIILFPCPFSKISHPAWLRGSYATDVYSALVYYYCISDILQRIKTVNKIWWHKKDFLKLYFWAKYNLKPKMCFVAIWLSSYSPFFFLFTFQCFCNFTTM